MAGRTSPAVVIAIACLIAASTGTRVARAAGDCAEARQMIDERLAAGGYTDTQVQLAEGYRRNLDRMCSLMSEKDRAQLVQMIDQMLPVDAARKQEWQALQEFQEKGKALAKDRARSEVKPEAVTLEGVPRGRGRDGRWFERDPMLNIAIRDWDVYRGKARILYTTYPSLPQLGLPDWKQSVYVVTLDRNGRAVQTLVTSKQAQDHAALALRRGHPEVVFERHGEKRGDPSTLERWSIAGRSLISSVPSPAIAWSDGETFPAEPFRGVTADGDVVFAKGRRLTSGKHVVGWNVVGPDGGIRSQGELPSPSGSLGVAGWIRSEGGDGGLLVTDQQGRTSLSVPGEDATTLVEEFGRRSIAYKDVGFDRVTMLKPDRDGYLGLGQAEGLRATKRGLHVQRISGDSATDVAWLEPLAKTLGVRFEVLAADGRGGAFVYGQRRGEDTNGYVVRLDAGGKTIGLADLTGNARSDIGALIPDDEGVWVVGTGKPPSGGPWELWVERVEFD